MKKNKNANLHRAKSGKNDEFYTQLNDIENELRHYKEHFKDKVVFCNCDDPKQSNFFKYFAYNFYLLGLKKLITTCYKNASGKEFSDLKNASLFDSEALREKDEGCALDKSKYFIYEGVNEKGEILNEGSKIDEFIAHLKPNLLNHDKNFPAGDFRSEQCIELLKQSDIVVTNPPFSLFREYVAQLVEYDKKFLIIGNMNAITYKEIFRLIKENKLWLGYHSGGQEFEVPKTFSRANTYVGKDENKYAKFGNTCWYTNLTHKKRNEVLETIAEYNPNLYPKYDNYDAIEVSKVKNLPLDYDGVMGVPITFLDKYNPEQFEIIGEANHGSDNEYDLFKPTLGGKDVFKRLLIKNKMLRRNQNEN